MSTDNRVAAGGTNGTSTEGGHSNDAEFRLWGANFNALLAALGMVQTADTGQINWSTAVRPTVVSTYAGYEIWRFNDALQATKPFYMKIEYGTGATLANAAFRVTPCRGTDGAGVPAVPGDPMVVEKTATSTATPIQSYGSGSSNRLSLILNVLSTAAPGPTMMIFVERTKDSDGNPTGDGVLLMTSAGGTVSSFRQQFYPLSGPALLQRTFGNALDAGSGGLWVAGTEVALTPTVAFWGKPLFASWLIYRTTDIPKLSSVPVLHLGTTRTFMPMGDSMAAHQWTPNPSPPNNLSIAMAWE